MKSGVRVFLAGFVLAASVAAMAPRAAAEGKAEGKLTVNGKATDVKYAYASAGPGFFDKTVEDVTVIVSDVPLDAKALGDEFERIHMADAGRLHAFEITIDVGGKPISTAFRHNGFKGPSPSGLSSEDVFTKNTFDGKTVDGHYKSAKQHEFFGNTYSFDVSFKADITRKAKPVPPSAAETAAAVKSPQAKVYTDFLKAAQKEDLGAMRNLMSKEQGKNLDSPDAKKMVGLIKMMSATDIKVLKIVEKGDTADLTVSGKQDGKSQSGVVHMVKESGAWKVQREEWGKLDVAAFLAKRFLFGSRRGLPKTVSLLALFGVALGAASLVVAMGLMSGYRHELAEKLAGTSAEVVAMPEPGANVEEQRSNCAPCRT